MRNIAHVILPNPYVSSVGALLDAVALIEERKARVLADEGRAVAELRVTTLTATPEPQSIGPITITPDALPVDADGAMAVFDFIWIPAFRIGGVDGARALMRQLEPLLDWLHLQSDAGAMIGCSGTSVIVLIAAGLMGERAAPMTDANVPLLAELFPRLRRNEAQDVVCYDRLFLSAGFGFDGELMARVIETIVSPPTGAWIRSVSGTKNHHGLPQSTDPLVAAAQMHIEQNFATGLSIAELAKLLHASQPTLIRRFNRALAMPPSEYVMLQRIGAAQRLLTQTNRPVQTIAKMVGFSDLRSFRSQFLARAGMSARAYRAAHQSRL